MQEALRKCVVALGAGLALMAGQGCRKQAAPTQAAVVRSLPQVRLNFAAGPLPVEDVDSAAAPPRLERVAQRQQQVQPMQAAVQRADPQAAAAAEAAAQRLQDDRLLQEQEAASQQQQEELDQEIEQNLRTQEEMEAEPRIQDIPERPLQPVPLDSMQPQ
jgi:hypothetical protein